jgi:hypothetical protein
MSRLTFPKGAETNPNFFLMMPIKFQISLASNNASQRVNRSSLDPIILPTPSGGISLNESGTWDETTGFLDFASGLKSSVLKGIKTTLGTLADQAIKGQFINDYASLSYQGSNFRTYSFNWELIPHSEEEAKTIYDIIQTVRKYSLPDVSGALIDYPYMWSVTATAAAGIDLQLQNCVISNLTVNYTPDGELKTYKGGYPTAVNLEIEFKELYRATRGDLGGKTENSGGGNQR